jgi:hypothetical protein
MPGFFRSLQPLLRFGLGLFVLALLGGLAQAVARWIEVLLLDWHRHEICVDESEGLALVGGVSRHNYAHAWCG